MFLYTIANPADLFPDPTATGCAEYCCCRMHNSYLQGVNCGGKFTISRLISTNPRHYLNPRFAPGSCFAKSRGKAKV